MWGFFKKVLHQNKSSPPLTKAEHKPFNLDLSTRYGLATKQVLPEPSNPNDLLRYANALEKLPMPSVLWDKYQKSSSAGASHKRLTLIIKDDPVLSALILKAVNSPAFGLRKPIVSLNRAISHLGNNIVRSIVAKHCFSSIIPQHNQAYDLSELWKHGMAVSALAEIVSKYIPNCDKEAASTIGLFHDIGRMGLNFFKEKQALNRLNHDQGYLMYEAQRFGCTHIEISQILSKHWKLPKKIQQGIQWHHHPGSADANIVPEVIRAEVFAVYIADLLAKHLEFPGGNICKTLPHESYAPLLPKTTLYDLMQHKYVSKELWRINCIDF